MENKFCDYKNLNLGKEEVKEVSEQELNDALNSLVARSNTFVESDKVSETGDVVNINFEGFCDGVSFEGGKGENYDLELGSNTFIPGFEDQLIGFKKGDKVDVNVTFPENYQAENLKGKPAVFKCEINAVKVKKIASLDDEFAKEHGCSSVDELRQHTKRELEERNKQISLNAYFDKLCAYLIEHSEIELTDEQMKQSHDNVIAYYQQMVGQYGMSLDQYLQMANKKMEEFEEIIKPDVIKGAKVNAILDHVAVSENIVATEEEVNSELAAIKNYYQLSDKQLDEFKSKHLDEFKNEIVKRKVSEFLVMNNN